MAASDNLLPREREEDISAFNTLKEKQAGSFLLASYVITITIVKVEKLSTCEKQHSEKVSCSFWFVFLFWKVPISHRSYQLEPPA
jgi:hypothetical protein